MIIINISWNPLLAPRNSHVNDMTVEIFKIHLPVLAKACDKRRPITCYTDPTHNTGQTIKHPFASCSRPNCRFCHISDKGTIHCA